MSTSGSQEAPRSGPEGTSKQSGPVETRTVPTTGSEETRSRPIPDKFSGNVVISTKEGEVVIEEP